MFLKIGDTWFNLACITRVQQVISRADPTRLNVFVSDKQQPITVVEKGDVEAVLAYLDAKCATGATLMKMHQTEPKQK